MSDLIRAGINGALVGASLGAPLKGRTSFTRLAFYDPIPRRMPPQDALDAWLMWAQHLQQGRRPGQLSRTFHGHISGGKQETAFGLLNLNRGLSAPLSGSFANPLSNGSLAFGRAAFWGLASHGDPDEAARWAYYDASIDHSGDGVSLPVAAARMVALAKPGASVATLMRDAASVLPKDSAFFSISSRALKAAGDPDNSRAAYEAIAGQFPDINDSRRAMAAILLGLLLRKEGFGPGVLFAAGCGGPADQAAMVLGAITGQIFGGVPKEWLDPLGSDYIAGHIVRPDHGVESIEEFRKAIEEIAPDEPVEEPSPTPTEQLTLEADSAPTEPETAASESDEVFTETPENARDESETAKPEESSETAVEAIAEPDQTSEPENEPVMAEEAAAPSLPSPAKDVVALLAHPPTRLVTEAGGLRLEVDYVSGASARESTMPLVLRLGNIADKPVDVSASLSAPEGWQIRSRVTDTTIPEGETVEFANVLQPAKAPEHDTRAQLSLQGAEIGVPLLAPEHWSFVGPFVNHEGTGYDHVYGPEKKLDPDGIYNGRSDLAVKWQNMLFDGAVYDLEPLFRTGAGVIYLCAYLSMPKSGPYQVVAAASTGAKVWVDGRQIISYHREHSPVPHPQKPYTGSAQWDDRELPVLIKLVRNRRELEPLVLYFLNEDGAPVRPLAFRPLA